MLNEKILESSKIIVPLLSLAVGTAVSYLSITSLPIYIGFPVLLASYYAIGEKTFKYLDFIDNKIENIKTQKKEQNIKNKEQVKEFEETKIIEKTQDFSHLFNNSYSLN